MPLKLNWSECERKICMTDVTSKHTYIVSCAYCALIRREIIIKMTRSIAIIWFSILHKENFDWIDLNETNCDSPDLNARGKRLGIIARENVLESKCIQYKTEYLIFKMQSLACLMNSTKFYRWFWNDISYRKGFIYEKMTHINIGKN